MKSTEEASGVFDTLARFLFLMPYPPGLGPKVNPVHRVLIAVTILVTTIGLDQWTKKLAFENIRIEVAGNKSIGPPFHTHVYTYWGNTIRILYAENSGAFLGMGDNLGDTARFLLLTVAPGVLMIILLIYSAVHWRMGLWKFISIQGIFAGGIGNLIDRVRHDGLVIDFLNVGIGNLRTGIFNVADMPITGGAILLLLLSFRKDPEPEPESSKT